jgi:hypothetical protein
MVDSIETSSVDKLVKLTERIQTLGEHSMTCMEICACLVDADRDNDAELFYEKVQPRSRMLHAKHRKEAKAAEARRIREIESKPLVASIAAVMAAKLSAGGYDFSEYQFAAVYPKYIFKGEVQ